MFYHLFRRYHKPYQPTIPGIDVYGGKIMHSYQYRVPETFAGQTVLIIGAGPSAHEILREIILFAKQVGYQVLLGVLDYIFSP